MHIFSFHCSKLDLKIARSLQFFKRISKALKLKVYTVHFACTNTS